MSIVALPTSPDQPSATPQLTLLEVKNHLFVYFLSKTTFSLADDLGAIRLGTSFDDPKGKMGTYKAPLIVCALDEMVKAGLLLVLDATHGIYMLTQPLGTFTQTVQISPYTAHMVADAFNFFARATSGAGYVANKLAISDTEIQALAQIAFSLRDQIDDMAEEMYGDGEGDDSPEGGEDTPSLGGGGPYGMN